MTGSALQDDCFKTDKALLRHSEALALLKERLTCVAGIEETALQDSLGRILAEDITSPHDVPPSDNSAVDGYAFHSGDYDATGGFFRVEQRIPAGHPSTTAIGLGGAAQIFTGALPPPRADTIAMQEDCELHDQDGQTFTIIPAGLEPGANLRRAGEDLAKGDLLLSPGQTLRPQDLAAIASTGKGKVRVHRRIRVALMSTGDEIRRPGSPLEAGEIYDSNHYLLRALCQSAGVEIEDLGVLKDQADVISSTMKEAAARADVLITTGGASQGGEDHVQASLDKLGNRHMWQLAIKPGKPVMFGQIGNCIFLGLPGNPVAAMVCFLLYGQPILSVLGGSGFTEPQRFQVPSGFDASGKKPGRREFCRGILSTDTNGRTTVRKFEPDSSNLITSLREADGLIEIPEEVTSIKRGDLVDFVPFF